MFKTKIALILTAMLISAPSLARNDALFLPIAEAMSTPAAKEKLNADMTFQFGEQKLNVKNTLGSYTSSRKTNAFNKTDVEACNWVFLSSLLALQDRAIKEGGNAVVNIHSIYNNEAKFSTETFECHVGAIMAGVALRGTVVKK